MAWYEFNQNNSGGSFDVDDKVCHRLFIEADNEYAACEKAESLGVYFDGCSKGMDCPCCGDRWSMPWGETTLEFDYEKFDDIVPYAQMLADRYGWTTPDARIYRANGEIVEVNRTK